MLLTRVKGEKTRLSRLTLGFGFHLGGRKAAQQSQVSRFLIQVSFISKTAKSVLEKSFFEKLNFQSFHSKLTPNSAKEWRPVALIG